MIQCFAVQAMDAVATVRTNQPGRCMSQVQVEMPGHRQRVIRRNRPCLLPQLPRDEPGVGMLEKAGILVDVDSRFDAGGELA